MIDANEQPTTEEQTDDGPADATAPQSVTELMSLGVMPVEIVSQILRQGFILANEAYTDRKVLEWCRITHNLLGFARLGQSELKRAGAERAKKGQYEGILPPPEMAIVNELRRVLIDGSESLENHYRAAREEDAGPIRPDRNPWAMGTSDPFGTSGEADRPIPQWPRAASAIGDDVPSGSGVGVDGGRPGAPTAGGIAESHSQAEHSRPADREGTAPGGFTGVRAVLLWFTLWIAGAGGTWVDSKLLALDEDGGMATAPRRESSGTVRHRPRGGCQGGDVAIRLPPKFLHVAADARFDTS